MRLIDADVLETHEIYEGEWKMVVYADDIDDTPTIKAEPVRRGRWKMDSDYPDRLICAECGAMFDCWHWETEQMHFCPNCGARMDGGEIDDEARSN